MSGLRLLFVKDSQNWPRSRGHDVHGFHLMQSLAARGHSISLATIEPPSAQAIEGLPLQSLHCLDEAGRQAGKLTYTQRRFASYYGAQEEHGAALARLVRDRTYDAVVLVARHLLPLLSDVKGPLRIWYPADDPVWHHLSQLKFLKPRTWPELLTAAINVVYERCFRTCYDRVWLVSPTDRSALRVFSGCRRLDVLPNGVDAEYYQPRGEADIAESCVFWGRLDFAPNLDALEWFIPRIWPAIRKRSPAARLSVFGFNPTPRVRALTQAPGVELLPDVSDLRPEVARRQVVVLPFLTGGGIKNKLLEAAALGMPIVCTRWALSGTLGQPPVQVCQSAASWSESLARLWSDPHARSKLGTAARKWVMAEHTWDAAARTAEIGIMRSLNRVSP